MAELDQEKIRVLAYQLWERDGCPEGKDDDYWHAAEKLLLDDSAEETPEAPATIMPIPPTRL